MEGEIELVDTNRQKEVQIDNFQQSNKKPEQVKKHSTILYSLVCACQFITIFLSIFLLVEPEHKKYVYLTYIIFTFVRIAIFVACSVYLAGFGKKTIRIYFLLDPIMLLQLASSLTYIFLNYRSTVQYAIEAVICYPFLLFFLVGNFRVMLKHLQWTRCKVIIYKMIKMIGSLYFIVYGSYIIVYHNVEDAQIFLLWIFTTSGFWAEMYILISKFDLSEDLKTKYMIVHD